ncbi:MAG TPA: hypothetical protein VM802_28335 [Chitinophaga sp.]|uniref:hypothetical protein n=1 Tax=Chitinophaga sp. TaxID=1869181 RepID=UPI002C79BB3E|nr:hypothetical protein [Chitinophaga sp.]HVI48811.1 hypothetical protein [Chitinophaga sp.]
MDPFVAGLWTIPTALSSIVTCIIAPFLLRFLSRCYLTPIGMVSMMGGLIMLALVTGIYGQGAVITATVLLSAGCGLTVTLGPDIVVTSAPPARAGAVAGISETCTNLGAALEITVLGCIGTIVYRGYMAHVIFNGLPKEASLAARNTFGGAVAVTMQWQYYPSLLETARGAFLHGFRIAAGVNAVMMFIVVAIVSAALGKMKNR